MNKKDFDRITSLIDALVRREKMYCSEYVALNPEDRRDREAKRDLKIATYYEVQRVLASAFKKDSNDM